MIAYEKFGSGGRRTYHMVQACAPTHSALAQSPRDFAEETAGSDSAAGPTGLAGMLDAAFA
jgi:hypothetical protein